MQINYNSRFSSRSSIKKKIFNTVIFFLILFISLFLLSKFNFPHPEQEIKKEITNEINKLK